MSRDRDADRVHAFVLRTFVASERTKLPTVRAVARSLGWSFERVASAVEGDPDTRCDLSSYAGGDTPLGDFFIEPYEEAA